MLHVQDLQDLLLQNYHDISKEHLQQELKDIFDLIDQVLEHMKQEYKVGEYNYNFKQTFKHLYKKSYHSSKTELQRQKDIIVHYREMLQLDMMVMTQHMSELLSHDILDSALLRQYQHKITEIQKTIAHFAAVIKSLKEMIVEK